MLVKSLLPGDDGVGVVVRHSTSRISGVIMLL